MKMFKIQMNANKNELKTVKMIFAFLKKGELTYIQDDLLAYNPLLI